MLKIHILVTCSHCNGEAYLLMVEGEDYQRCMDTRLF